VFKLGSGPLSVDEVIHGLWGNENTTVTVEGTLTPYNLSNLQTNFMLLSLTTGDFIQEVMYVSWNGTILPGNFVATIRGIIRRGSFYLSSNDTAAADHVMSENTPCLEALQVEFWSPTREEEYYRSEYYSLSKQCPSPAHNYSFSPPVTMYHALAVACDSALGAGLKRTYLDSAEFSIELDYCSVSFSTQYGPSVAIDFQVIYPVTHNITDWSPRQVNSTVADMYLWVFKITSLGWTCAIDAITANAIYISEIFTLA
jgi:hypothetical protein